MGRAGNRSNPQRRTNMIYLFEMILGWLIGKRNGGEYFIMEDEK